MAIFFSFGDFGPPLTGSAANDMITKVKIPERQAYSAANK